MKNHLQRSQKGLLTGRRNDGRYTEQDPEEIRDRHQGRKPLKLYKVDQPEISSDELEQKISDTRKRWNSSANGANEKFAERDRERLEKLKNMKRSCAIQR